MHRHLLAIPPKLEMLGPYRPQSCGCQYLLRDPEKPRAADLEAMIGFTVIDPFVVVLCRRCEYEQQAM
jgi:hypothetical protein